MTGREGCGRVCVAGVTMGVRSGEMERWIMAGEEGKGGAE